MSVSSVTQLSLCQSSGSSQGTSLDRSSSAPILSAALKIMIPKNRWTPSPVVAPAPFSSPVPLNSTQSDPRGCGRFDFPLNRNSSELPAHQEEEEEVHSNELDSGRTALQEGAAVVVESLENSELLVELVDGSVEEGGYMAEGDCSQKDEDSVIGSVDGLVSESGILQGRSKE